jgi:hypothetical protein
MNGVVLVAPANLKAPQPIHNSAVRGSAYMTKTIAIRSLRLKTMNPGLGSVTKMAAAKTKAPSP